MERDVGSRWSLARVAAGVSRRARLLFPSRPRPAILMYHRIAHESFDPWALAVNPQNFARQLEWLSQDRVVLRLPEFAARHRDGSLPAEAVALTFDDGYACAAEVAAPLLEKFGLPATIFLPVDLIEAGALFWWDELQHIVLGCNGETLRLGAELVELGEKRRDDIEWKPFASPRTRRQAAFYALWANLRLKLPAELDAAMAELRSQAAAPPKNGDLKRPMAPEQVRATSSDRIEFGSHALTHPSLPQLSSGEKARQIRGSFERCAALSGNVPLAFAYPYGDFDQESADLVEESGFDCACATGGRCVSRGVGLFALPRIGVCNGDGRALARALSQTNGGGT